MEREKSIKSNNSGLSILELIVVLAIMAVVSGIFILSTSFATDKQVTSCAERIASSLEQTRSLCLGKQSGEITISKLTGDNVKAQMKIDNVNYGDLVSIGHQGLTVNVIYCTSYTDKDNYVANTTSVLSSETIKFSRNSGSVKNPPVNTSVIVFQVTNGRRTINVCLDTFTGRVTTERVS